MDRPACLNAHLWSSQMCESAIIGASNKEKGEGASRHAPSLDTVNIGEQNWRTLLLANLVFTAPISN